MLRAELLKTDLKRALVVVFRLCVLFQIVVKPTQVVQRLGMVQGIGPTLKIPCQDILEHGLALFVSLLGLIEQRKIVYDVSDLRVIGAEGFLTYLHCRQVGLLRLGVLASYSVEPGNVVQRGRHLRVVGPARLFVEAQVLHAGFRSFGIPPLIGVQQRQVVQQVRHLRRIGILDVLVHIQRTFVKPFGVGVAPLAVA